MPLHTGDSEFAYITVLITFQKRKKNDWNFPKENSPLLKIPMFAELNTSPNLTKNKSTRLHVKRTFKNLQEVLRNKTATGLGKALALGPMDCPGGNKADL